MRLNKYGRYIDAYRGNGWFVSWFCAKGSFLICFRPMNWHCYYIRPPGRPWARRLYVGPIEFELNSLGRP